MKTLKLVDTIYNIQNMEFPFRASILIATTPKKYVVINGDSLTATNHLNQALVRITKDQTISEAMDVQIVNAKEYQNYLINPNK